MTSDKQKGDKLCSTLEDLTIGESKNNLEASQSSPMVSNMSNLNEDVQARLLLFQQTRAKSASVSNNSLNNKVDKPLPRLPTQQHREHAQTFAGEHPPLSEDDDDALYMKKHRRNLNLNIPSSAKQELSNVDKVIDKRPESVSSPSLQYNQQGTGLQKRPSLSQRRGMKFALSEMGNKEESGGSGSQEPQNSEGYDKMEQGTSPVNLRRELSERKSKANLKLNLNEVGGSESSPVSDTGKPGENVAERSRNVRKPQLQGLFANYSKYVDIKSGSLNFAGKASLHSKGIDFLSGSLFRISLDELEFLEELGHGNYGVVLKVKHKPTGVLMAMKEVRLELDETKLMQILMELEVLHKCHSDYIVEFYGAFFVEGAVYMCMEFMNGGSLDKVYAPNVGIHDEACLAYITECVIRGLKELKDDHNIIHRDVKPTNILVNTSGKVKLCDFGVSGNLVASLAKTNIGCQSYMAPERIKSSSPTDSTYSIQSDIWSLGLTILEISSGHYPYPSETYGNIFSQLSAIVDGEPPRLDPKRFSKEAQLFVKSCLNKSPDLRPSYNVLLNHPWIRRYRAFDPHMGEFVNKRMAEIEEEKSKKSLSRSNSASKQPESESVSSLLKNRVQAPALHRGGIGRTRKSIR